MGIHGPLKALGVHIIAAGLLLSAAWMLSGCAVPTLAPTLPPSVTPTRQPADTPAPSPSPFTIKIFTEVPSVQPTQTAAIPTKTDTAQTPQATLLATPTADRTQVLSNGQSLFNEYCSRCHTTAAESGDSISLAGLFSKDGPVPPLGGYYGNKLPNGRPITSSTVFQWVRSGGSGQVGTMPGFSFSTRDLNDLVAYLRTLGK